MDILDPLDIIDIELLNVVIEFGLLCWFDLVDEIGNSMLILWGLS